LGGQVLAYLVTLVNCILPFSVSNGMVTFSAEDLDGSGCGLLQQHLPYGLMNTTEDFSLEQPVCEPRLELRIS
jgi:hypothetical protein